MVESCVELLSSVGPFCSTVFVMIVGAASAWYFSKSSDDRYIRPYAPLDDQSVLVPGVEQCRMSRLCENGELMTYLYEDARTLYDCLPRGMRVSENADCLGRRVTSDDGRRPYVWQSFSDTIEQRKNLAKFFVKLGLAPGQQTFVGIYSRNRPEWIVSEHATYVYSMVNVPLYDTLGYEAVCHIIRQTDMTLIVCENIEKVKQILKSIEQLPSLRYFIVLDPFDDSENGESELTRQAVDCGVRVFQYANCIREGEEWSDDEAPEPMPPKPDDLATICYTSGTTDLPKGVMLTHGNVIADACVERVFIETPVTKDDTLISYLPLAHMFERLMESCVLMKGGRVGYYSGDVRKLRDDMQELRPTLFPTVPRLMNRIQANIMLEAGRNALTKFVFDAAVRAKLRDVHACRLRRNTVWDLLVFRQIRRQFGDRLRVIVCGSAPVSRDVLTLFRVIFACTVAEGYGQTECVASATLTVEGEHVPSHVGPPMPGNLIKVIDVPDMDYYAKDGWGEVCVKGANVFLGYFKEPEKTAEALDADGWLHTGDIGRWTERGSLQLIDRKKHIFKLAQGEYIAPEKLENAYLKCKYISQIFVHGDSLQSFVVAIVVPHIELLQRTIANGMRNCSAKEICQQPDVKKIILEDMQNEGKKANLCSFEQVKDIYLCSEQFTVENNLLTPTLKSKRVQLRKRFEREIKSMYDKLS